ncbi:MAG TPA: O-antigen ligase family protein [Anaerolineales bacterium]|nr:O-antigen ligase family protein [Anaerolineales bacterium]
MSQFHRLLPAWQKGLDFLWAFALFTLPMTSFSLLIQLTNTVVAPLSALPILILAVIWFIPFILRGGVLPIEARPLVVLVLVVLLANAAAFFINVPPYKERVLPAQELRAFVTLIIGVAFYFVIASWPNHTQKLHKTWQWLTISGIFTLVYALIQSYFILGQDYEYPYWMERIQEFLVVQVPHAAERGGQRISGLTYEPSWFAHQLVILYLPLWLAATYQRTSAFRFRVLRLSLENLLLVPGIIFFFLASPRIGLISFMLLVVFLVMKLHWALYHKLLNKITSRPWANKLASQRQFRWAIGLLINIVLFLLYLALGLGLILVASLRDERLLLMYEYLPPWKDVLKMLMLDENTLLYYSNRLAFMERMVYWTTGWTVFRDFPWLGVGLGNSGFFFPSHMPAIGWGSYEVSMLMFDSSVAPNIKSLWVRLLAETGALGFAIFITWLYLLFRSSQLTCRSHQPVLRTLAFTGQLALVAFIGEGFSIDSFAMPYWWVITGIISAAGLVHRQDEFASNASRHGVKPTPEADTQAHSEHIRV